MRPLKNMDLSYIIKLLRNCREPRALVDDQYWGLLDIQIKQLLSEALRAKFAQKSAAGAHDQQARDRKLKQIRKYSEQYKNYMSNQPFKRFGIGISGYITMVRILVYSFMLLTVLSIIQILLFKGWSEHDMNESLTNIPGLQFFVDANKMMSTFPFSEPKCINVPFELDKIELTCPYG